jgi:hypothetical protein
MYALSKDWSFSGINGSSITALPIHGSQWPSKACKMTIQAVLHSVMRYDGFYLASIISLGTTPALLHHSSYWLTIFATISGFFSARSTSSDLSSEISYNSHSLNFLA